MDVVELRADLVQQLTRIAGGLGELTEMMLEVFHPLTSARKRGAGRSDDINLVLQLGEEPQLLFVGAAQLERLAQQRSDQGRKVQARRSIRCGPIGISGRHPVYFTPAAGFLTRRLNSFSSTGAKITSIISPS